MVRCLRLMYWVNGEGKGVVLFVFLVRNYTLYTLSVSIHKNLALKLRQPRSISYICIIISDCKWLNYER